MQTIPDLFDEGCSRPKDEHLAWREPDGTWRALSTAALVERVGLLRRGLLARGLVPGDRVALIARNSERWAIADWAMLGAGLVNVPLYPSLAPEQVRFALEDSGSTLLLLEDAAALERLSAVLAREGAPRVVLMDDAEAPGVTAWSELLDAGRDAPEPELRPGPSDLASIIYTSGTTGRPKGVMLTHANLVSNALASREALDLGALEHVNLSMLPLCHIFQRITDYFLFVAGARIAYCPSPLQALEYMAEVRPTFFASVPRLYEKVRSGFLGRLAQGPAWRRQLAEWATWVGRRHFHAWYRDGACDGRPSAWLRLQRAVADRLVLARVRAVFGGNVDICMSGGAALPPEVHEFFRAVGLGLLPGYGLTEASPVIATNRRDRMKLGSVGPPIPGVETRLTSEGELLARGPNVMIGYWNRPEETAEAVRDGWLHTGDLARVDEAGYLFITGRKKEVLVLSTGKNVSPQVVEDHLCRSPMVSQVVVLGDDRKHVAALVRPNLSVLATEARRAGLGSAGVEDVLDLPGVEDLVLGAFADVWSGLSEFERPKRVALLPRDLSLEHGELTPTLKYRRKVIVENWSDLIESMYGPRRGSARTAGSASGTGTARR